MRARGHGALNVLYAYQKVIDFRQEYEVLIAIGIVGAIRTEPLVKGHLKYYQFTQLLIKFTAYKTKYFSDGAVGYLL